MAGICTASVSPNACSHRVLTVNLDGQSVVVHLDEDAAAVPLTTEDYEQFVRFGIRRAKQLGVSLAQLLNRVVVGDEATNVKQYHLIAVGSAVTKTNIGTAYSDILPGLNGQRSLVDCTGCTQFRIVLNADLVGTGPFGARVVRDSDNTVLFENAALGAAGERELDTNWQPLPAWAAGLEILRVQAKSATASDDPIFRRCLLVVR